MSTCRTYSGSTEEAVSDVVRDTDGVDESNDGETDEDVGLLTIELLRRLALEEPDCPEKLDGARTIVCARLTRLGAARGPPGTDGAFSILTGRGT